MSIWNKLYIFYSTNIIQSGWNLRARNISYVLAPCLPSGSQIRENPVLKVPLKNAEEHCIVIYDICNTEIQFRKDFF